MITDDTELALLAMSPATMDPIRTWAKWNDAVPGLVEIDLVGHEGGNAFGEHCYTSR